MTPISIYSSKDTPRLRYITHLIFDRILGIPSEVITKMEDVYTREFVINYSSKEGVGLQIIPHGILFEKQIREIEPATGMYEDYVTLFPNDGADIPFDVLSACFYMVSRYEEYLPHKRDKHNRYAPENSIAFTAGFLEQPIVNIWANLLKSALLDKYPRLEFEERHFSYVNTIDVDYAYAFKEKGLIRTIGGLIKDVFRWDWKGFTDRFASTAGWMKDPFDTFRYILDANKKYDFSSIFFFHVGDYDVNDKSIPVSSNKLQALIKEVNDYSEIGLHPSYASFEMPEKLTVEFNRLSRVIHQPVNTSRFHFIKMSLPQSYRALIELDVKADYSMGYASKPGFRAGICTPFPFYDLDYDVATNLEVYPFYIMEATILYYLNEGPEQAMDHFKKIIDEIHRVDGCFISVWHNDALSEWMHWKGWSAIYEEMLFYVNQKMKE